MEPVGQLGWIQIDCREPLALAVFWSGVLGLAVDQDYLGEPPHYVGLVPTNPNDPVVTFQRVPEPKITKNRLHLDVRVVDADRASAQVEELGGRKVQDGDFHEYGYSWRAMTDPEGNEFCLIYGSAAAQ
jgi:predicted enzyme related to lactoylglutathione lyase